MTNKINENNIFEFKLKAQAQSPSNVRNIIHGNFGGASFIG